MNSRHPSIQGRLLYIGRIEPYKNVERLVEVFATIDSNEIELRVVGKAGPDLRKRIADKARRDQRIGLRFGFVPDEEMVAEISSAQVIVLPYTEMHNSGILLVALSLARPVLVPRTPANILLADEVGQEWVHMFEGPLEAADVVSALRSASALPDTGPDLDGRDWRTVGQAYAGVYWHAVQNGGTSFSNGAPS